MAEEKSQEAAGVGIPGGSAVDAGASKSVPPNACWVCGEPIGPTYVVIQRYISTAGTPECVRVHHACYRNARIMGV